MTQHDPFFRVEPDAADNGRERRVGWLDEVATALFEDRLPSRPAALFLWAALSGWLRQGGKLERDYLRVTAPRGSHHRPDVLWRRLIDDERQEDGGRED